MQKKDFQINDIVLINFPDGEKRQGIICTLSDEGGIILDHPHHGNMCYGIYQGDLQDQNVEIQKISPTEADFDIDYYKSLNKSEY